MESWNLPPLNEKKGILLTRLQVILLAVVNILVLIVFWVLWKPDESTATINEPTAIQTQPPATATFTPSLPETAFSTVTETPTAQADATHTSSILDGTLVMSLNIDGYAHLFIYDLQDGGYVQLTDGEWDDIHPAVSPAGDQVAFASNRRGYWDIYILDLQNGEVRAVTLDEQYDGHPTWSPDGAWIAFETYLEGNLEIAFTLAVSRVAPIRLTDNDASDHSPAWAPNGRIVAFVSDLGGSWDIWQVDLDDTTESRLVNLTKNPTVEQSDPTWSGDGNLLSWASTEAGERSVYFAAHETSMTPIGSFHGGQMIWGPGDEQVLAPYFVPESNYLAIYDSGGFQHLLPPIKIPGQLEGIDWGTSRLPTPLAANFRRVDPETLAETLAGSQSISAGSIFGRQYTIPLVDVDAPHPELSALAVEPFFALRDRVMREAGWDVLSSLEQAFVPITQPLEPGRSQDWLYTGRAFTLPPVYLDVGWMVVAKEEYAGKVYWRVYMRAMKQDGSQGRPLHIKPWDFNARFTNNTTYYEQGGAPFESVPEGYWVDFTALARATGWERLPALSSWEHYFHAARFNEFVITSGLDWEAAMLQLYPPEILATPSPVSR